MSKVELDLTCFATLKFDEPWTLKNYRAIGGYTAWEKIVKDRTPPDAIIEDIK